MTTLPENFGSTSRGFFLCELGMKTVHGDEVFYYSNIEGVLHGAILTHVDDFYIAGTPDFVKRVIDHIRI